VKKQSVVYIKRRKENFRNEKDIITSSRDSAGIKKIVLTGWTDVDLTEKEVAEAEKAGETLKELWFQFDKLIHPICSLRRKT
jgi:2,3-bisphosphoglycerate-dependent phosphoglycerate mutase